MPLTDVKIKNLQAREQPYKVSDFGGLYVEVRPTGSKLWRLKYRFGGREKRLAFGAYPAVALIDAREERDAATSLLAKGIDQGKVKQEEKRGKRASDELTFERVANAFLDKGIAEGRAPATQTKNAWLLAKAITDFGQYAISEIKAPLILDCLRKVEAKGNYETAHRLRAKISTVFRFAVASGIAEVDPAHALCDALIRPSPKSRAAITDATALGGLLRAIDGFDGQPTTRIALQLQAILAHPKSDQRSIPKRRPAHFHPARVPQDTGEMGSMVLSDRRRVQSLLTQHRPFPRRDYRKRLLPRISGTAGRAD